MFNEHLSQGKLLKNDFVYHQKMKLIVVQFGAEEGLGWREVHLFHITRPRLRSRPGEDQK